MFGLFKNKKKEFAKEIFGAFKPKIEVANKLGKWESNLSFGDAFIVDDYLLSFLNTYIAFACREYGYTGQDAGFIMMDVYEQLDKTYGSTEKQQQYLEASQMAKIKGSKDCILGQDNALMFFLVVTNNNDTHKFSKDPIYQEAYKYFESGKFKTRNDWAKKNMPELFADGDKMSEAPSNIVIAYRIFENTFEKKLNKVFKV